MTHPQIQPVAQRRNERWAVAALLVGIVLAAVVMRSPITGVGSLLPIISTDDGLSVVGAGLLTALPLLAFAGISPLVPRMSAALGLRRSMLVALLLVVAGVGVRWVPGVVPLFAGTLVVGSAIAVMNVLLPALARREFPSRVAAMTSGYVVVMSLAGGAASGLVVPLARVLPGGWRSALAVWGAPAVLAVLVWAFQARRAEGAAAADQRPRAPWRSGLAWSVTAFMGCQSLIFYVLVAWLPTILLDRAGLDAADAGWNLSLLQGAGVLSSLAVPFIATNPTRARRASVTTSLIVVAGLLLVVLAPQQAAIASLVLGLGAGATVVLALSAISARSVDAPAAAALSGMAQSVGYLVSAAGPVAAGALHALTGSWNLPLLVLIALGLGQSLAAWAAGRDAQVR